MLISACLLPDSPEIYRNDCSRHKPFVYTAILATLTHWQIEMATVSSPPAFSPSPAITSLATANEASLFHRQLVENLIRSALALAPESGKYSSEPAGVTLHRTDSPIRCEPTLCEPSLCFILQGSSSLQFGDREIHYDSLTYLASNIHVPVVWQALDATPDHPYLAVKIKLNAQEVTDLLLESGQKMPQRQSEERECSEIFCGLSMAKMDTDMLMAVIRLLSVMTTPDHIPVLAPLARREIIYRALMGEIGPRIRKFATEDSQAHRITRVINALKDRFDQPLRIGELANEANMSESTLFHTFKKITRMSPLQFQKKLRLQEARRLMMMDGLEAAVASYRVGYESPSQFSREYSRMFGASPKADVGRLRAQPEAASAP